MKDPFGAKIMEQRAAARYSDAIANYRVPWLRWYIGGLALALGALLVWGFFGWIPEVSRGRAVVIAVRTDVDGKHLRLSGYLPFHSGFLVRPNQTALFSSASLADSDGRISGRVHTLRQVTLNGTEHPLPEGAEENGVAVHVVVETGPLSHGSSALPGMNGTLEIITGRVSLFRLLFPRKNSKGG